MIKKILMISENDIASNASLGVTKKILGQYKAFQNLGYDVYNLCLENGEGVLIHGEEKAVVVPKKVKSYFTVAKLYTSAAKVCAENNIDCCYIRYPLADWAFMRMIKRLHKICKVVVEFPTFPYDTEKNNNPNLISNINRKQDAVNRKRLKKYVDLAAGIGEFDQIFGIRSLSINNGVPVCNIPFEDKRLSKTDNVVHLIAVALIVKSQGFDRIIEGLKQYYRSNSKNRIVKFDIVGNGPYLDELKMLVKQYQLNDYVCFYGILDGSELDVVFEKSDIGVTYLAGHRNNCYKTSSLKLREYCARGIPFIGSLPDDAFPEDKCPFYKLFPANDDPIDIEQVIEFYDYVKAHPEIHRQMRTYAEENLIWEKQLKKVIDEVNL